MKFTIKYFYNTFCYRIRKVGITSKNEKNEKNLGVSQKFQNPRDRWDATCFRSAKNTRALYV